MIEIKMEGFDKLQKQLKEAERATKLVHGEIATLEFDPRDLMSKREAIREGNRIVDQKLGKYKNNPFVEPIIDGLKQFIEDYVNNHKPEEY